MTKQLYLLFISILIHRTFASFCGSTGVPFSFEVLPSGAPILGCAQPTCVAHLKEKKDDSNFLINANGQADGFMRVDDKTNKAYGDPYGNKLIANCSGQFSDLSCPRKDQWVGGIEYIDHPRQPLILQCCTFSGLRFSQEVGLTNVGPGEAITGGEVIRDGRQISFDVIANVRKVVDVNTHVVSYEVTVRRMHCLPDPPEPVVNFEKDASDEIVKVLTKATDLPTLRTEKASKKEKSEDFQSKKALTDATLHKINEKKQHKKNEFEEKETSKMDVTNRNEAIQKRAEMEAKTTYSEIPPKSHAAQLFTSSINNYKSETGSSFSDGNRIGFTNNLRTPLDVQAGVKSSGQQQIRAFSQQQEVFGQPQVKAPGQEEFGQQQARAFGQQQEQQAFVQPQIRAFGQQQEVFNQQQLTPSYRPEFGYTSFQQQGLSQNIQPRQSQSHGPCATQCQQNSCYMQRCNRGLDPVFGIPTFAPPLFPLTLPTLPTFSLPTVTPPTFQPFISYPTVAPPSSHSPLQPVPGYIDSSGSRNTISQNSPSFLPLSSIKENFDPNDRLMQLSVAPIAQAATASVSNAIPVQSSEVLSGRPILLSANPASSLQATLKPLSTFEEFIARLGYRNVSLAPLTPAALVIPSEISLPNTYSSLSPLSQTTTTTVASPENQARLLVPGFDFQTSQRNPYQPAVLYIPQQWPLTTSENGTLQRSSF
ncbi:Warthog protein [Dirofilaria immitis]